MLKLFLSVLIAFIFHFTVAGQRPDVPLNLTEATSNALEYNHQINQARLDQNIAQEQYNSSSAVFLPQVTLSYTSSITNNPLMVFGSKLMQGVVTPADFNPVSLNNPADYQNHNAMISVNQPLFNADAIYQRRAAHLQQEVYQYRKQYTDDYITFEVKKTYYQLLLSYEVLEVLQQALVVAERTLSSVNDFYVQGLANKAEFLNAQVYKSGIESQLLETKNTIAGLSDQLSVLMNKNPEVNYVAQPDSAYRNLVGQQAFSYSDNRADFMAYNKLIESYNKQIQSVKYGWAPRLNAFGNYQSNSNVLGFGNGSYYVGMQLSMNVFNGLGYYHKISLQKYQRDKIALELNMQQSLAHAEIEKSNRTLNDISSRIQQVNLAMEQAREALRLTEDRYQQGLVKTTDLLTSQNLLSQQELMLSRLYYEYNITVAYLMFLTNQQ